MTEEEPLRRGRFALPRTRHTLNLPDLDPHPTPTGLRLSDCPRPAIAAIPSVRVAPADPPPCCAVCTDDFSPGEEAKCLPCAHLYHPHCILPWLSLRNSCPVCRSPVAAAPSPIGDSPLLVARRRARHLALARVAMGGVAPESENAGELA